MNANQSKRHKLCDLQSAPKYFLLSRKQGSENERYSLCEDNRQSVFSKRKKTFLNKKRGKNNLNEEA